MTCFSCEIAEPLKLTVNSSFIHLVVCLTTGPKPLPKRALSSLLPKKCVANHNLCQPVDKMPRGVLVHFFVRFFPVVK
jgi:hypothetical protein